MRKVDETRNKAEIHCPPHGVVCLSSTAYNGMTIDYIPGTAVKEIDHLVFDIYSIAMGGNVVYTYIYIFFES